MNSQIVEIKNAVRSRLAFVLLAASIAASLYLKPGFVSVSVMWFTALCVYNARPFEWSGVKTGFLLVLPVALYLLFALGLLWSGDFDEALNILLRKVHLSLLPIAFVLAARKLPSHDIRRATLGLFTVASVLASVICLVNAMIRAIATGAWGTYIGETYYSHFGSHLLTSPLHLNPVYVSLFCSFSMLVTLYTSTIEARGFKLGVALYLMVFIVLCGSLAGVVSSIIVLLIWLLKMYPKRRLYGILGAVLVSGAALLPGVSSLRQTLGTFSYPTEEEALDLRLSNKFDLWESALAAYGRRPLLGYGTGSGQEALERELSARNLTGAARDSLNAHNEFLSTALDIGLPGLLCLLLMLGMPLVHAARRKDLLAVSFFVTVVIFFLVESVLLRQKGIVFFSLFYSVIVSELIPRKAG